MLHGCAQPAALALQKCRCAWELTCNHLASPAQGDTTPPLPLFFSDAELEPLQMPGLVAAARHDRRKFTAVHER